MKGCRILFRFFFPGVLIAGVLLSCGTSPARVELAQTYYNLGNAYLDLERWDDAESAYARAMDIDPGMYRAGYNMARIYINNKNYPHAVELLTDLLEKDPSNIMIRESLAWCYLEMGEKKKGEELYRGILLDDPANCDVRYNLSLLLREREEWEGVHALLMECVDLDEGDGEILFLLGRAERESDLGNGLGWMEQAAKESPKNLRILEKLAGVYREEQMFIQALEVYDTLLSLKEEDRGRFFFEKSFVLYTAMADPEKGFEMLEKALEAGYEDPVSLAELLLSLGYLGEEDLSGEMEDLLRGYELLDGVRGEMKRSLDRS